jgi:hypothetical protein
MSDPLPTYSEETLNAASVAELMRMLQHDEDRVPRNVIHACAARGDEMLDALAALLGKDYYWGEDQTDGEWWRLLHAVMILGLMDSQRAGETLVDFMRRMDDVEDETLQEWLAGFWPALFRNKPAGVLPELHALAEDASHSWHVRGDALNSAIAWTAERNGEDELHAALDRAARHAFSRSEDFDLRVMLGATLLAYARARDRRALEHLADAQPEDYRWFGREDIVRAYATGGEALDWERFTDPWAFYDAEEIEARRKERAEAHSEEAEDGTYEGPGSAYGQPGAYGEPYVRETPKIGRNDPCPCGSGKKYKKCCMPQ